MEGNRRLTTLTAIVLLVLLAVEGLTVLAGVRGMLSVHVFVGMLLLPPIALKLASVGYRFVRYYTGSAPYRTAGPPTWFLRALGPFVVVSTVTLFGSGVALIVLGPGTGSVLAIHKLSFIVWGISIVRACARPPTSAAWRRDRRVAPPAPAAWGDRPAGGTRCLAGARPRHRRGDDPPGVPLGAPPPLRRSIRSALRLALLGLASVGLVTLAPTVGPAVATAHVARTSTSAASGVPAPIPGDLLIADRGNDRILLVNNRKRLVWRYPGPDGPSYAFRFDDDTFFGPSLRTIISNQEDQNTIQILSFPAGRVLWHYGHPNIQGGAPGYLHTPDDAYQLPNGLVSVADAYNCRVIFIAPSGRVVRQIGETGVCAHDPPRTLGAVNGATPLPGGGTLVSEIAGSWIDAFSKTGQLMWSFQAPVSYPSDPQWLGGGRILLADYASPGRAIIVTTTGRVLWKYGPRSGAGALDHPSLALWVKPGLIAINDDYRDRVVLVSIPKHRIVWQYGHTDVKGTAPGYLDTPDGLDVLPFARAASIPQLRPLVVQAPVASASASPGVVTPPALRVQHAAYRLPAAVQRAVAVPWRGKIVIAGGLDSTNRSAQGVFELDPVSGRLRSLGTVPLAFHDAAGAILGGRLLIFGGGSSAGTDAVQAFDLATHASAVIGHLPNALSDLASAQIGDTTYLVGGYDGRAPRGEILATRDGRQFTTVGQLPVGLRYPAVATVAGRLVIAGGETGAGLSKAVFSFDPGTGAVTEIGLLPESLAHASVVVAGDTAYIVGGRTAAGTTGRAVVRRDCALRATGRRGARSGRRQRSRDAGLHDVPRRRLEPADTRNRARGESAMTRRSSARSRLALTIISRNVHTLRR